MTWQSPLNAIIKKIVSSAPLNRKDNKHMKIIFFGTPHFVIPVLEILTKKFDVVAVVTAPDQKAGRKQLLAPSPIKQFANEQGIPVFTPTKLSDTTWQAALPQADFFVVAAYGKIIPPAVLSLPTAGAVNIHPSLLPLYRGPAPITAAIKNGDTQTGISIMLMDEQMDHGPLLKQTYYPLTGNETFDELASAMFSQAALLLPEILEAYQLGNIQPKTQDDIHATYVKIISKQDGYIDVANPPEPQQLDRMIRAYFPWPTVWTKVTVNGQEKLLKCLPKNKLQLEGKNPMTYKEFFNGYPSLREQLAFVDKIPSQK